MGIGSYCVPSNNASNHQVYWKSAQTPENATDANECGWYIIKEKDESDRVWVT